MLKGLYADRSLLNKLFLLLIITLGGSLFITSFGVFLASLLYSISIEEVYNLMANLHQGEGRAVFKIVQSFNHFGTYLFPSLLGAYLLSRNPEQLLGTQHIPQPFWLLGILSIVIAFSMGSLSDLLYRLSLEIPWPSSWNGDLDALQANMTATYQNILNMTGPLDFVEVFLVMALIPAIAEESLFRGVLQPLLARKLNPHLAIFISSFVFALLHLQHLAFLSIFFLGAVLGYLRFWTKSIWPSTLVHLINNGAIVVLVYFFDYNYLEGLEGQSGINWSETFFLLALLALSLVLTHRFTQLKNGWTESK